MSNVPILVTGASGNLGAYLIRHLVRAGHPTVAWSGASTGERFGVPLRPVDLSDPSAILAALDGDDPGAVLHAAAISTAAGVWNDPIRAAAVNVEATRRIADWCASKGRRLLYTSTDLVFDGSRPWNREDDPAEPVLSYGRTKFLGERPVLDHPLGLVARLSLLYGPSLSGRPGYFDRTLSALRLGEPQAFFEDEFRTPLPLSIAAAALVRLLMETEATGIVHVGGLERLSRFEMMRKVVLTEGLDPSLVRANRQADVPSPEPRPADVSLDTTRLVGLLPDFSIEGSREIGDRS